jgi:predicted metal-dependent hydrolase
MKVTAGNSIVYEGRIIPYDITYSPRRKSIAVVVHHTKRVEIKAPSGTPAPFIQSLAGRKAAWIARRLRVLDSLADLQVERNYHEGEVFYFLGAPVILTILSDPPSGGVRCERGKLIVSSGLLKGPDQAGFVRSQVQDWYRHQAERIIGDSILESSRSLGVVPPPFRLRNARRRWGSCNHKNHLNFSVRLVMAPHDLVEYVVMHELCHIRHKNHSREFWESLRQVMPDYRERRGRLRHNGYRYVL